MGRGCLLPPLILACAGAVAQENAAIGGFRLDPGASLIKNDFDGLPGSDQYDVRSTIQPSLNTGFWTEIPLSRTVFMGVEATFTLIKGWEEIDIYAPAVQGGTMTVIKVRNSYTLGYLAFPMYLGVRMHRFDVHAGARFMWLLDKKGSSKSYDMMGNAVSDDDVEPRVIDGDSDVLLSVGLRPSEMLRISLDYYHGLRNIADQEAGLESDVFIRQLCVGVHYTIW